MGVQSMAVGFRWPVGIQGASTTTVKAQRRFARCDFVQRSFRKGTLFGQVRTAWGE